MTRGRRSVVALGEAVLIAKKRGETRQFMHGPGTICNFVIYCAGFVAHVRIKRVRRLHSPHAWIEREAADALATLRSIASAPGISRELWIFLPSGSFRFFRATDMGLIELDRSGAVLPVPGMDEPAERAGTGISPDPGMGADLHRVLPLSPEQPVPVPSREFSVGEFLPENGAGGRNPTP